SHAVRPAKHPRDRFVKSVASRIVRLPETNSMLVESSAGGGDRTHTPLAGPRILSPVRLPVSPPRRDATATIVPRRAVSCDACRGAHREGVSEGRIESPHENFTS